MAFAVNLLATFNQEPKEVHMKAPNRVLDRTVWFDILQNQFLQFTQVLTGALWLPKHGDDNVWWIWSAKQKSVSLSTAEAEYMNIVERARTGMWFRQEAQRLTFNMYILYSEVSVAKLFQCQMTKLSSFSLTIRQLYKSVFIQRIILKQSTLLDDSTIPEKWLSVVQLLFSTYIPTGNRLADILTLKSFWNLYDSGSSTECCMYKTHVNTVYVYSCWIKWNFI